VREGGREGRKKRERERNIRAYQCTRALCSIEGINILQRWSLVTLTLNFYLFRKCLLSFLFLAKFPNK
jgi:hypothetical protein